MKTWLGVLMLAAFMAVAGSAAAQGQGNRGETVIVPDSSKERPEDFGRRAHTNHLLLSRPGQGGGAPWGLNPDVIRAAYGLPAYSPGDAAGAQVIAVVDAYDYPTAVADFNAFSQQFGLPQETGNGDVFEVIYASGQQPKYNSGWSQEAALDIEWAHAMAPSAKIVLVETASNSWADLLQGVDVANGVDDVREVSMSWGGSEFRRELSYDGHFAADNVVYFASSGDSGGKTIWPGVSPNVVSAGGTTLNVSVTGGFLSETGWKGSGGGGSKYEPRPPYQYAIRAIVASRRGTPDLSFDADPYTGVSVYWQGSWLVFGGTSVSAPSLAGIINLVASSGTGFAASSFDELGSRIYANLAYSSPSPSSDPSYVFRDIISGSAGKYRCKPSWDFVTGVGSNWGLSGK
jgi:subtilase family serine protease